MGELVGCSRNLFGEYPFMMKPISCNWSIIFTETLKNMDLLRILGHIAILLFTP